MFQKIFHNHSRHIHALLHASTWSHPFFPSIPHCISPQILTTLVILTSYRRYIYIYNYTYNNYYYMGRCPAKSPFWSFNFITIKIVRYKKQHIFTTVLYFLFKFRTLVHTSVLSVKTYFGALDIFRAMVTKVSNPMG